MEPDSKAEGGPAGGLVRSVQQLLGTILEIIQTRVEIVSNEVEEEREQLRHLVLYGLLTVLFLAIGLLLATLFLVLLFWDEHRLTVIGVFAGLYLGFAIVAGAAVATRQRTRQRFLATTIAELQQDRDRLRPQP
jgi:uncharacterized membrane protein YqjE